MLVTISDRREEIEQDGDPTLIDHYEAFVVTANDYYPFGMLMPGRRFRAADGYRYGFNGHEVDREINDHTVYALYWEYDGRIGRRWNTDPIDKVWESPYATFLNNPILFSDPDGANAEDRAKKRAEKKIERLKAQGYTNASYKLSNNSDGNIQVSFLANQDDKVVVIAGFVEERSWVGRQLNKAKQFTVEEVLPRLIGGLKATAGGTMVFAGALLSEIGIGIPILIYGADLAQAGARQLIDGKSHKTFTQMGLESLGLSEQEAATVDLALGTWVGVESATVLSSPRGNVTQKQFDVSTKSPLREAYEKEVRELQNTVRMMKNDGAGSELIARTVHSMRRALGVKYKNLTPPDLLQKIYSRNMKKYGDPLGPSIEYLRKQGKAWDAIIESATRPGGEDLNFNQ